MSNRTSVGDRTIVKLMGRARLLLMEKGEKREENSLRTRGTVGKVSSWSKEGDKRLREKRNQTKNDGPKKEKAGFRESL